MKQRATGFPGTNGVLLVLLWALPGCGDSGSDAEQDARAKVTLPGEAREGTKLYNMGPVAEFSLIDQDGRPFTRASLAGKIWVVDFIFTSCGGPCPRMTNDLRRLSNVIQQRDDVRFLSVTVDPAHDTPEVLKAFAAKYDADLTRWSFVTGDKRQIYDLAAHSFYLPVEEGIEEPIHSTRFVVVDRKGEVRGYHDQQTDTDPVYGVQQTIDKLLLEEQGG